MRSVRSASTLFSLLLLVGLAGRGHAQPAPSTGDEAAASNESTSDEAPAQKPVPKPAQKPAGEPRDDEVWQRYHRAYAAAARGQNDQARTELEALVREHRTHPASRLARSLLATIENKAAPQTDSTTASEATERAVDQTRDLDVPPERPRPRELPSSGARAELASLQVFHGMAVGAEICVALSCESPGAGLLLTLAGGATGLGLSLGLSRDRLTEGHRALFNSGAVWGTYHGVMAVSLFDPDGESKAGGLLLLGQAMGMTAAGILTTQRPTEGQVALANTFGIWSGVATYLAMGMLEVDRELDDSLGALLLASDFGLLLGAFVAQKNDRGRGYTLLLDAGGLLGALGGLGVVASVDEDPSDRVQSGGMLVGLAVGLVAAAYWGRNWGKGSKRSVPARVTLMPNDGGLGAGLAFDLDL